MMSPSAWREWIEIKDTDTSVALGSKSPSAWREWIEIIFPALNILDFRSPSAWREWIEIPILR